MTAEEIIASGKLELYVCGSLTQEEAVEVEQAIEEFPEVKKETESIEESLINLAETVAPTLSAMIWAYILNSINKVRNLTETQQSPINWAALTGWAAAILFMGGILWMLKQNNDLNHTIQVSTTENTVLKEEKSNAENRLAENEEILQVLRSKDYQTFTLPGNQAVAPEAFAKVYLNKKESVAFIDAKGLPAPPRGKVYQVWSLKMKPLTASSMGLIEASTEFGEGLYKFMDFPPPEAFGITLEPEGGSETPTLSQLYILGTVNL